MNLPNGYLLQKGKYKIKQVIGQGGFGITYKGIWITEVKGSLGAMRTELSVCVKEYFFKDYCFRDASTFGVKVHSDTGKLIFDKFKEKLIKEAKILSEVHHPYIVNVLEVFEENNTAYIVMEYIDGCSLKEKLAKEGVLPETDVLRYMRQIGEALQFVHRKNILHLDIKPSNILIDKDDNARLIDFGVSKRYDVGEQETSTTLLTLSKGFASIEQYDNGGITSFSPCPDIYSLGATMYDLLTGKIPTESILRAMHPLPGPRELNPSISEQTERVIMKALEIVPSRRYSSVGEMMEALGEGGCAKADVPERQPSSPDEEDEETILQPSSPDAEDGQGERRPEASGDGPSAEEKPGKPSRNMAAVAATLLLLAAGSAAVLYYQKGAEDAPAQAGYRPVAGEEETGTPVAGLLAEGVMKGQDAVPRDSAPEEAEAPAVAEPERQEPSGKPENTPDRTENTLPEPAPPEEKDANPPAATRETAERSVEVLPPPVQAPSLYDRLLASGKEKMDAKDYAGAKGDFMLAKNQMVTEEVMLLLFSCDEKIEERDILERRALYEEKMPFGHYTIVRKKSNDRYGAIDDDGKERIPCKYLSVGRTDDGRAFEREDNLYDIYDSDGSLIADGVAYY